MSQKNGSYLAGVSREFLVGLPLRKSKVIQVILLPLALYVDYRKNYNECYFSISKVEMVDALNWPKSYKDEGNFNKLICRLVDEIGTLKVNGIRIIKALNLTKGVFEIEFTEEAMDRYFQGLRANYFPITLDTIQNLKSQDSWNFVKEMFISYDFTNGKYMNFMRHTKTLKERFGLNIDDYMVETTGKFDRSKFEKRRIQPIIDDLLKMKQINLYPVGQAKDLSPIYLGKTKKGKNLVDNYYVSYKINKV